ncbi:MAG TPA: hypothetical protein VM115_07055 [Vicinamibacterales bacterium]|nr:hypothetical protein [Vicinamibacterales bacterium]
MIPDYRAIIEALDAQGVDYIVVGAVAMVLHGSARMTRDLDLCYSRENPNLQRLAKALQPFAPTLRDAPIELPFRLDAPTLRGGLNFTLRSSAGDVDLLGELTGIGSYAAVLRLSIWMKVYDRDVRVLDLDGLERAKRAAGRLKDLADLAEIRDIRRIRDGAS